MVWNWTSLKEKDQSWLMLVFGELFDTKIWAWRSLGETCQARLQHLLRCHIVFQCDVVWRGVTGQEMGELNQHGSLGSVSNI